MKIMLGSVRRILIAIVQVVNTSIHDFVWGNICKYRNNLTFSHLKTKFHHSYVLALNTNFSVVTAMLPIMEKLKVILKSECVNTWEFWHSLRKELKVVMIFPLKNIFYSAMTYLIWKISQFSLPTTMTLRSP